MFWRFCVILFASTLVEWQLAQCAPADGGKTKGKVRAYEFGYSIEENQHRHEKRDENGIVMGEFGFITADGIYHVTVYATDENGKFKILAMKNYPYRNPEKKMIIAMLPPLKKQPVVMATTRKPIPTNNQSCGGCVLTKKLTSDAGDVAEQIPGRPEAVFRPLSKTINDVSVTKTNGGGGKVFQPSLPSQPSGLPLKPNTIGTTLSKNTPSNGKEINYRPLTQPQIPVNRQNTPQQIANRFGSGNAPIQPNQYTPAVSQFQRNAPSVTNAFSPGFTSNNFLNNENRPLTPNTALNAKESKSSFQPLGKFLPNGGSLFNGVLPPTQNTIQSLTQNTLAPQQTGRVPALGTVTQTQPINNFTPTGMQIRNMNDARTPTSNLPSTNKLTTSSQSIGKVTPLSNGGGPLYRFNYVLDYNSHREEGRLDGSKEGNYNTIDEDGIRRIIDYIANENGYQPHIKWERVPPNELPTGENKLKDYEFVWFNTPSS